MLLKRIYSKPAGWKPIRRYTDVEGKLLPPNHPEYGRCLNTPPVSHVEVKHTGTHREQNFSTRLIEQGVREGWIRIEKDKLTMKAMPEDLVYTIKTTPGHYCLHCGKRLESDPAGQQARAHVEVEHPDAKSPMADNPAGYARVNAFLCVLDEAQHRKYMKKTA